MANMCQEKIENQSLKLHWAYIKNRGKLGGIGHPRESSCILCTDEMAELFTKLDSLLHNLPMNYHDHSMFVIVFLHGVHGEKYIKTIFF